MYRPVTFVLLGVAAFGLLCLEAVSAQNRPVPSQPWKSINSTRQSLPPCAPAGCQVTTRYAPVPARPNPFCQCGANGPCTCNCTPEQCALGLCPPGCLCRLNGSRCSTCKRGDCVCRQCPPGCQCAGCAHRQAQRPQTASLRPAHPQSFGEQQVAITRATLRPAFPE